MGTPIWLSVVQLVVTIGIAVLAASIACRQWQTAEAKLKWGKLERQSDFLQQTNALILRLMYEGPDDHGMTASQMAGLAQDGSLIFSGGVAKTLDDLAMAAQVAELRLGKLKTTDTPTEEMRTSSVAALDAMQGLASKCAFEIRQEMKQEEVGLPTCFGRLFPFLVPTARSISRFHPNKWGDR